MIKMGMRKKIRGLKPNEIKALNRGTIRLFELIKDLIDAGAKIEFIESRVN